jgi:Zn-dependent protease
MIPVPPLDGSRLARSVLPVAFARPYASLERSGFLILLALIFLLPMLGEQIGLDRMFSGGSSEFRWRGWRQCSSGWPESGSRVGGLSSSMHDHA